MRTLSASEVLDIWEQGQGQSSVKRALKILSVAYPDASENTLAKLSIGQRDAFLLTLREWNFGSKLVCLTTCPGCSEPLEMTFDIQEIRVPTEPEPPELLTVNHEDYEVSFRLPNSLDMEHFAAQKNIDKARQQLLTRCLLAVQEDGEEKFAEQLPKNIVVKIIEQMAQADPQAEVQLSLDCPECHHRWSAVFDIVSFFWEEISTWALRILREVHILAATYGWSEADILGMTPHRRQLYLKMIGS